MKLNSKFKLSKGGIPLLVVIVGVSAALTTTASANDPIAGVIGGSLVFDGQPSTGFVKITIDPPHASTFQKGDNYQQTLVAWQKVGDDGKFSFSSSDLTAKPRVAQGLATLAANNGGYVNFDVVAATPEGWSIYSAPRQLLSTGKLVVNASEGEKATFSVVTQQSQDRGQGKYDQVMQGTVDAGSYCSLQTVVHTGYPQMQVGITHRWDGSTASFFYNHVSDSTFDAAVQVTGGHWSISGSTHTSNSTGFAARVWQETAKYRGTYRSKYKSERIMYWDEAAGGNPHICGYRWHIVTWIGGLITGPHVTGTLDGRCNTVPPDYNFPEGAGSVSYHQVHAERIGGSVRVGAVSIGGSTGLTGSIGWNYTLAHAEWLCGATGHVNPAVAPNVAVGPRYR